MDKTNKITIKEAFYINKRALIIWWQIAPQMFLSTLIPAIVSAIVPFVGIYFSAQIINELAGARSLERLFKLVVTTLVLTSILAILQSILNRWRSICRHGNYFKENKLYFDKLLSLDYCELENNRTFDLLSRLEQNRNWMGVGFAKQIWQFETFIFAIIRIIGAISLSISLFTLKIPEEAGAIVVLNHPLFIIGIIIFMIFVTCMSPILSVKSNSYMMKCDEEARMGNRFLTFYGFMSADRKRALDIRIYRQEKLCNEYMKESDIVPMMERYAKGPMGLLAAASSMISQLFSVVVLLYVCLKAWGGAFGVGSVTQYVSAIEALASGVASLISTIGDMRNNAAFMRTNFAFLDIPNDMYQGSLTVEKRADRKYDIEFKDVSFKYPGSDNWALRHVSMKFQVGERLAVVGQNGSGKTTFIKLLCRLYDPTEGEILLNGINIRKYNYKEYMNVFSIVFQDFKLLALPLGENVAAGKNIDKEKAEKCLHIAGFAERLVTMEQGLDTYLYKNLDKAGVDVSGGEKQKIAIARSIYKDAPFVILDEPTAALDPISEYEIYTRFNELVEDKTAIYISHRLSSCRFCDEIAVFDKGTVVQKGKHEELLGEKSGKYFELWNAQAQYYTNA